VLFFSFSFSRISKIHEIITHTRPIQVAQEASTVAKAAEESTADCPLVQVAWLKVSVEQLSF
jgi:hypothetical protein